MTAVQESTRTESVLTRAGAWLCLGGAAVGALGLLGWITGTTRLTTIVPGLPPMMPNTALALLLIGGAGAMRQGANIGTARSMLSLLATLAVLAIGVGTLIEYGLGIDTANRSLPRAHPEHVPRAAVTADGVVVDIPRDRAPPPRRRRDRPHPSIGAPRLVRCPDGLHRPHGNHPWRAGAVSIESDADHRHQPAHGSQPAADIDGRAAAAAPGGDHARCDLARPRRHPPQTPGPVGHRPSGGARARGHSVRCDAEDRGNLRPGRHPRRGDGGAESVPAWSDGTGAEPRARGSPGKPCSDQESRRASPRRHLRGRPRRSLHRRERGRLPHARLHPRGDCRKDHHRSDSFGRHRAAVAVKGGAPPGPHPRCRVEPPSQGRYATCRWR